MPLEQSAKLHLARRVLRVVAPEYRLFVNTNLEPGECVLDLQKSTIEVGESGNEIRAVASVLFNIGHLKLTPDPDFAEHSGDIGDTGEKRLVAKLVRQGVAADLQAVTWAAPILSKNWNLSLEEATELLNEFSWNNAQWEYYYRA